MSLVEAQLITAITVACLMSMAAAVAIRRWRPAATPPPAPAMTFSPVDWLLVILVIGFSALPSLLSLTLVGAPAGEFTVEGLAIQYFLRIVIAQIVFLRLRDLGLFSFRESSQAKGNATVRWIILVIAVTMGSNIAVNATGFGEWIVRVTGAPPLQHAVTSLQDSPMAIRILIASGAILIAPFVEELCFRGYLYPLLKRYTGAVFATVSVSVLFGIIHTSLVQFLPLTIMSVMLILAYERTRTLWTPIAAHLVFNTISVVYILFYPSS